MCRGRALLGLAAMAALAWPGASAAAGPQRIMSMNLCADLLLLQMVPTSRVASVSFLAGARAPGVAVNHGTAEDILAFKPDLILAGDFSTPRTRKLAALVGARVVTVSSAYDFAGARRAIRQVGAAVGEPARAEALVADMDAKLAGLASHPPARRFRVVAWSGGISAPGEGTLANAIIEAAGAVNLAAQPGMGETSFGMERLLAADPDALLSVGSGGPSVQGEAALHRVVRRYYGGRRIAYDEAAYACGLPQSADAAVELRRRLDALPPRQGGLR